MFCKVLRDTSAAGCLSCYCFFLAVVRLGVMSTEARNCVSCGKNTFGQNDSCPFCGTKQPNKMKRGSTKNARVLSKGESLGLAQFAAVELGQKGPPKPRLSKSDVQVEEVQEEVVPSSSEEPITNNGEELPPPVAKKPPVNAAGAALAALMTSGSPALRKKSAPPTVE
jgi:hypothetical protein